MEYSDFYERIYNIKSIKEISEKICANYDFGEYISHKEVRLGYEDFNYELNTKKGKYFVKILNKDRTDDECDRYIKIMRKAEMNDIHIPRLYKSQEGYIYKLNIENKILRICVIQYINGSNMYLLDRELTTEEIKIVSKELIKISKTDFDVNEYYDEWTVTYLEDEYNKKAKLLNLEYKILVDEAYKQFKSIEFEKLKKSYIQGDIIKSNLIIDENNSIWVIDFAAVNYLPRILELVVTSAGICVTKDKEETINRINLLLREYNKYIKLDEIEIKNFAKIFNCVNSMYIIQAGYIQATR